MPVAAITMPAVIRGCESFKRGAILVINRRGMILCAVSRVVVIFQEHCCVMCASALWKGGAPSLSIRLVIRSVSGARKLSENQCLVARMRRGEVLARWRRTYVFRAVWVVGEGAGMRGRKVRKEISMKSQAIVGLEAVSLMPLLNKQETVDTTAMIVMKGTCWLYVGLEFGCLV